MHPPDCPGWEYESHPNRQSLKQQIASMLVALRRGHLDTLTVASDTRPEHGQLFRSLTPLACEYYAGHYRGENFRCLRHYEVTIQSDPRVGAAPRAVEYLMEELANQIRAGLIALDANVLIPPKQRVRYAITIACSAFVNFLTIHPYANGNGHAGRLIVWSILGRYGLWPLRWTVDPRPPDPPYSALISQYRSGNCQPLETFVLQMLSN
jgi:Fic/DOC family